MHAFFVEDADSRTESLHVSQYCARLDAHRRTARITAKDWRTQSLARLHPWEERLRWVQKILEVPRGCLPQLWRRCMATTNPKRSRQACLARRRKSHPFSRARAWAKLLMKRCVVENHLPPTSTASTTRRALARRSTTAAEIATPAWRPAPVQADQSQSEALTHQRGVHR